MSDFFDMAGHLIRRMHQISVSVFADHMVREDVDLTPVQFAALSAIEERPGLDQATLAGMVAYDRATLGGVVDRLETKGFLSRRISPSDRRARALTITAAGEELLAKARPIVFALQDDILAELDAPEREALIALLQKATNTEDLARRP
ncbi:MAG: MarR family winged helix-turn-helix transcriptional regulator [Pikeienuella sp.]